MTGPAEPIDDPVAWLRQTAEWLFAPELGVCVVGSAALALACRAAGSPGPRPGDLDLAWAPAPEAGAELLRAHGVFVPTTVGNQERGTLGMRLAGRRIEITTLRGGDPRASLPQRIASDLGERDMTIGALAVELASGRLHDPHDGRRAFGERRIAPVGDPAQRVREHAIRWLRYYRKAHELGFALDRSIRSLAQTLPGALLGEVPPEAVALELRAMLLKCPSPGRCLQDLHEDGLLAAISSDLDAQFDGRVAGPQEWHPEISLALHLVLALEWTCVQTRDLDERDRLAVHLAVLCHDFGKIVTPSRELPRHPGHELLGMPLVAAFLDRWPGLADQRARQLALHVCELHLEVRRFAELRSGTLAKLYDQFFRPKDYPVELFALAVAGDVAGRLGREARGLPTAARVRADLEWLRATAGAVDAAALHAQYGDDVARFREKLHEARAKVLGAARRQRDEG